MVSFLSPTKVSEGDEERRTCWTQAAHSQDTQRHELNDLDNRAIKFMTCNEFYSDCFSSFFLLFTSQYSSLIVRFICMEKKDSDQKTILLFPIHRFLLLPSSLSDKLQCIKEYITNAYIIGCGQIDSETTAFATFELWHELFLRRVGFDGLMRHMNDFPQHLRVRFVAE